MLSFRKVQSFVNRNIYDCKCDKFSCFFFNLSYYLVLNTFVKETPKHHQKSAEKLHEITRKYHDFVLLRLVFFKADTTRGR